MSEEFEDDLNDNEDSEIVSKDIIKIDYEKKGFNIIYESDTKLLYAEPVGNSDEEMLIIKGYIDGGIFEYEDDMDVYGYILCRKEYEDILTVLDIME